MDRYQKVEKPKAETPINENELRITAQGRMRNYISYAMSLLQDKGANEIVLKATGRAINKTVMIAELIKATVSAKMPKSKRNKIEHEDLKFKEFREQLKSSSRFFLGSNKVMQVALGRSASDEIRPASAWDAGLFLTNMPREEIESLFNNFEENDFARTGSIATEKVELPEGPLDQFTHEMEPFLRKQGMPVRLNKGVVELVSDFVVCEEGKPLSPESARILRLLGIKMATFRLNLICRWSPEDFELYMEGLDESDVECA
ncbi:hypothetical protein GQ457_18G019410 [Hibiscus cannabinus]